MGKSGKFKCDTFHTNYSRVADIIIVFSAETISWLISPSTEY